MKKNNQTNKETTTTTIAFFANNLRYHNNITSCGQNSTFFEPFLKDCFKMIPLSFKSGTYSVFDP